MEAVNGRATRRAQLMKKLCGTQWGANSRILGQVYKGYVRPVMEYASSAWGNASKTTMSYLDKTQNQSLRIVLGALKSTPLKELHKQTEMPHLEVRRQQKALIDLEKSKRNPTHPLHNLLQEKTKNRLKKRKSPSHCMKDLFGQHNDILHAQLEKCEMVEVTEPIHSLAELKITLDIPGIEKKDDNLPTDLRTKSLAYCEEEYPGEKWTHIYTDGSADGAVKNGGGGIHISYPDGRKEQFSIAAGAVCTNYTAELTAIKAALEHISTAEKQQPHYVIFCDSRSALQSLENAPKDKISRSIQTLAAELPSDLAFQWIPSHCDIPGNEIADKLAKTGSNRTQEESVLGLQEAKSLIKNRFSHRWKTVNDDYSLIKDEMHSLPRNEQSIIFRLRTGHCRLGAHMKRIGLRESAACQCGEASQTVKHVLQDCTKLKELRREVWSVDTSLETKLWGTRQDLLLTADFIKRTDLNA